MAEVEPEPETASIPMDTADVGIRMVNGIPEFDEVIIPEATQSVATYSPGEARLIITHIVNENFKSYANRQVLGPFQKSFSCTVGPNGSGKSNIIDSMLFVFGYRANKIRSKKISTLIHKSEEHKSVQSCTVEVHFEKIIDSEDDDAGFTVVENSNFKISRTGFKDDSSYYKLNGKKTTYKDIAAVLRKNGIDLDHNRFLILQGEVEQIAMMKPKAVNQHDQGMLEFLEDIIGCCRYKDPLKLIDTRIEVISDMRREKLNRIKAVKKEIDSLEGAKNEAVEYLTLENDIVKQKNVMFQRYIMECTESHEKAVGKRDEIHETMKAVTEKLDELKTKTTEVNREHKKIFKRFEALSVECDEQKEKFTAYEKRDVLVREDLKHALAKNKNLENSLKAEKKKLDQLKLVPDISRKDLDNNEKKKEKLEVDLVKEEAKLAEVMASLQTETADLRKEKEAREAELVLLQKDVNETKSKMTIARSKHELYLKNLNSAKGKLDDTKRNLQHATKTLQERLKHVKDLEEKIPAAEDAMKKAENDVQCAMEAENKLVESVRTSRRKVEEVRRSQQQARSHSQVVDFLMELKKEGKVPGLHGRLGDLGAIDTKYDVAISTACGPLDFIVCDAIDDAQECVQHLKRNNIGLATFIGLDKMQKWNDYCHKKIKTPENVPRLFDLIQVKDQAILPAFYYALRDTLVATDLDQATRIAYGKQRYRVVTLGGALIDVSGTMSGGGGKASKGRMGSQLPEEFSQKDVDKMEKQLEKDSSEVQHCRHNIIQIKETVTKLKKSLTEMRHMLKKCTIDITSLQEQEQSLKKQEKEQEQAVKAAAPNESVLKELEKEVDAFKEEYETAKAASGEKDGEVHKIHNKIMEIGGSKLSAAETRVAMINKQIDQVTGQSTKVKVAIKTACRNAEKCEEKIKYLEEEITEGKNTIEKLRKEFSTLEVDAAKVIEGYQGAQVKMKEAETELHEIKTSLADLEKQEHPLQKKKIAVKHELENIERIVKDNQAKLKHWTKELAGLSLHQIELGQTEELETVTKEQLANADKEAIQYYITLREEELAKMKPNMAAIVAYREKEAQYLKRVAEMDTITKIKFDQVKLYQDLCKERLNEFMTGFTKITDSLKTMYQMITLGGDAELELVDSLDPFSEGIIFSVRPPKKSWKRICNLSGGEKTLSSLALVFALHQFKPSPLYVMDEIDAALDIKNVSIVANYIKERTKNAQFIIISLRNNMFELANRLIGIYKTYNCSKSVALDLTKFAPPVRNEPAAATPML